ncbi:MAG: glycosyltransferase family 4 protein [Myxococcaceae bacterium]|nr:glycosyltransferase family 4 protein [Myxococcaceae bacterium]
MPSAIHQVTPTLSWGDAVGNQVRLLRRWFREAGHESEVFSGRTDERSRGESISVDELPDHVARGDLVLVHHSIQSRLVPLLRRVARKASVAVIFHNVTPPALIAPYDPPLAAACAAGLEELRELAPIAPLALTFSRFSAKDLDAAGFAEVKVVPFPLEFAALDTRPDEALRSELDDGMTNVLFVGRGAPNKRIEEVLRVFTAYQRLFDPKSRLVLAGELNREHPYGAFIWGVRDALGPERVHILGRVSDAQLAACFATASVYLSMSAHEGFGVPLIEALYRGVPVIAYDAGAVAETLGGAGWVCRSADPIVYARLIAVLQRRPEVRRAVIERSRLRARAFDPANTRDAFFDALMSGAMRSTG